MAFAQNPILTGFHPDPSLLRVGGDYYLATSTFEWFPGVAIHHSTDLIHWKLVGYPLTRLSQLDMRGCEPSCGIWAPCLSYDKGTFYLIYTNVRSNRGIYKDTPNYLVTAPSIEGPWSEPVYLNSSGFDPSLFHDADGRKWLVNMLMDYRCWNTFFGGIVLQEYSEAEKRLVGERKVIFRGTPLGCTEGPHLYRRDGYYYLVCAEGGTGYEHAVTVARSRTIDGPYELSPHHPTLTALHRPTGRIQKAGHASLCEGANGHWYLAHLCGRPVGDKRRCILGRETALEEIVWENGWPRLKNGTNYPEDRVEIAGADTDSVPLSRNLVETFDGEDWDLSLQTLREPLGERASLTARPGWLRLYGADSMRSTFLKSILAHRQQSFFCAAQTKVDFFPENFQQLAGLTYYYDELCNYTLYITADEVLGRVLTLVCTVLGKESQPLGVGIRLPETGSVWMKVVTQKETAQFFYSLDGEHFEAVGPVLDATVLSDDIYAEIGEMRFTGAYLGICCHDLANRTAYAEFDTFRYEELDA